MAPPPGVIPVGMQRTLRRMSRDASKNRVDAAPEAVASASSQDCGPTHLMETLNARPEYREAGAVRAAMEWWLQSLPISGLELAPELCAENFTLLEMFLAGRLATFNRNQVLQEEGEEVKHYSIILFGKCRLRCAKPAVGVAPILPSPFFPAADNEKDDSEGREAESFINIEVLGRGESMGLYPGEQRSPYNIVCTEKTTVLQITAKDYEAILRSFHRDFFQKTVDFLEQNNVFPEVGTSQLKKIAPLLRQRRVPRGQIFVRSGEYQRHLYFLREGSCSLLVHDSPDGVAGTVPLDEEEVEADEDATDHDQFLKMRSTSYGPRMQQTAAYDEQRKEVVKNMARGPLKKALAGGERHAFRVSDGAMHTSATLTDPGVTLGEEALVHDNFRDWVNLRNCYSVRAARKCSFFVADITSFKVLLTYMGSGEMTQMVSDRLNRRCKQFTRGRNVQQRINKRAQEMKANEFAKLSRQKLRLPPCAGYPAVDELEDADDYLDVVLEHRKPPPNATQLPTLTCLEGTVYGPRHNANGPGVTALLQAVADGSGTPRRRCSALLSREWRDNSSYEENPMGSTVGADARYGQAALPGQTKELAIMIEDYSQAPSPKALKASESLPELSTGWGGGVFLNTEVEFDDGMTLSLQSQGKMVNSSSLPSLPSAQEMKNNTSVMSEIGNVTGDAVPKAARLDSRQSAKKREQKVMKTFSRVMVGKNVLILTDKPDLKKQIARVLVADDTSLVFLKSSNDLWHRMRDSKEDYHVLLLDLTKSELQVEPMLRTIRQHTRYSDLQIIVLSQEQELPEAVRNSCSFAVFLPLAASMLREALVWCFDRKSGRKLFPADESQQEWDVVRGKAQFGVSNQALVFESPVVSVN